MIELSRIISNLNDVDPLPHDTRSSTLNDKSEVHKEEEKNTPKKMTSQMNQSLNDVFLTVNDSNQYFKTSYTEYNDEEPQESQQPIEESDTIPSDSKEELTSANRNSDRHCDSGTENE